MRIASRDVQISERWSGGSASAAGWRRPAWPSRPAAVRTLRNRVLLHPDGLPEREEFALRVGSIGTGTTVVRDPHIFDKLSQRMRKVVGLEMEGAAIGAIAYQHQVERMIVMKGVMDHADPDKTDNFKQFAARAAAECLIAFLRQNLPPKRDPLDHLLEPGTSELPPLAGPAALLNARHRIVPFYGRTGLLEELRGWCEGDGVVGVRLIHGAGGMGKTRLLIELCKQMRVKGWRAGFAPNRLPPGRFAELVASEGQTLAVIDYAESRLSLRELLAPVLRRRAEEGGEGRLRVVLLSRAAGDWWNHLLGSEVADLLRDSAPTELSPLVPAGAERETVFREAVARFAKVRGKAAEEAPAPDLGDPRYDRVLYVHMAALATVDKRAVTADMLMEDTLNQEEKFWAQKFGPKTDLKERLLKEKIRRVVAALTLRGGAVDKEEAAALVERVGEGRDKALVMFLRDLYPGGTAEQAAYLAGLEPDLLGEAMVFRALTEERGRVGVVLDRVFEGAGERAIGTGFEVLGRLSGEHADAEGWITRVLDGDVPGRAVAAFDAALAIAVEDPIKQRAAHTRLGMALAKALERDGTIEIARRLRAVLPEETVALREVALWVTETLLRHLPEGTEAESLAERAGLLSNRGARQRALGRREVALASTVEAVAICRKLVAMRPEAFLPHLARSLHNLGGMRSELGQREAALASAEEAVAHYRTLVATCPEAFLPYLANGLNNLGTTQSELGQREAALASAEEAVAQHRKLVAKRPEAFLADLAMSLNNLGNMQSKLGQREAALASADEAVAHCRTLVATRPEAFLPHLASSLANLGVKQSELGQREAALASVEEAVAQHRKLVARRPEAFLPDLASSLDNLGNRQSELGQHKAALASSQEAVAQYHKLVATRPEAFLPDLASSLDNLGNRQSELGLREAALTSTEEAVARYHDLVATHPEAFLHELARSLNNLGTRQGALGQHEAALASTEEAVAHYRKLVATRPEAFLPNLAMSLNNLGFTQSTLGLREATFASAKEAVAHYRKLVATRPEAFLPNLAMSLNNLGNSQSALGQHESAFASAEEAVAHYRTLVATRPDVFLPDLANGLNNLGNRQSELGQHVAALASAEEAVAHYRTLVAARPEALLPELAISLNNLGNHQSALGQHEAALVSVEEAVTIRRKLVGTHPEAFLPYLAGSLNNLGTMQNALDQHEAALASAEEAVAHYRTLVAMRPEAFLPDLALSLNNLGTMQNALDQHEAARASAEEALATIWPFFTANSSAFAQNTAIMLHNVVSHSHALGLDPSSELRQRIETFNAAVGA